MQHFREKVAALFAESSSTFSRDMQGFSAGGAQKNRHRGAIFRKIHYFCPLKRPPARRKDECLMFGIPDPGIWMVYVLIVGCVAFSVWYGIKYWNEKDK